MNELYSPIINQETLNDTPTASNHMQEISTPNIHNLKKKV